MNTITYTQTPIRLGKAVDELVGILDQNSEENDPLSATLRNWGEEVLASTEESNGLSPEEAIRLAARKADLYREILLAPEAKGHRFASAMEAWAGKWNPKIQAELALLQSPKNNPTRSFLQQLVQKTRLAQQELVGAQTRLLNLPNQIDQQIVAIQERGAVVVAEATQKAQAEERALQGQTDAMSQAHQADLNQRAQEMTASEQKQSQEIANMKADMEQGTRANRMALAGRRKQVGAIEQVRDKDRVGYQQSLQQMRQGSNQASTDLQRHLAEVQARRRAAIGSMESQKVTLASKMAGQVSQAEAYVVGLEQRLTRATLQEQRLSQAVQINLQSIDDLGRGVQHVQAELNHQRERRRGTRIFGKKCIIS